MLCDSLKYTFIALFVWPFALIGMVPGILLMFAWRRPPEVVAQMVKYILWDMYLTM